MGAISSHLSEMMNTVTVRLSPTMAALNAMFATNMASMDMSASSSPLTAASTPMMTVLYKMENVPMGMECLRLTTAAITSIPPMVASRRTTGAAVMPTIAEPARALMMGFSMPKSTPRVRASATENNTVATRLNSTNLKFSDRHPTMHTGMLSTMMTTHEGRPNTYSKSSATPVIPPERKWCGT